MTVAEPWTARGAATGWPRRGRGGREAFPARRRIQRNFRRCGSCAELEGGQRGRAFASPPVAVCWTRKSVERDSEGLTSDVDFATPTRTARPVPGRFSEYVIFGKTVRIHPGSAETAGQSDNPVGRTGRYRRVLRKTATKTTSVRQHARPGPASSGECNGDAILSLVYKSPSGDQCSSDFEQSGQWKPECRSTSDISHLDKRYMVSWMNLVSWNVWNRNREIDKFKRFLREQDADVFAFQELTSEHIELLRSIQDYNLYLAEDFIEGEQLTYLGILTRLPVRRHEVVTLNSNRQVSPSWIGRRNRWIECLQSHNLTLLTNGLNATIVNVHLSCGVSPTYRHRELLRAIEVVEQTERIVICGDMNTFANPAFNWLVGWFYGSGVSDLLTHEIGSLDRFAHQRGMLRMPRKAVTFPRLKLQLDHIITRGMDVSECTVERDSYGSDHVPITIRLK